MALGSAPTAYPSGPVSGRNVPSPLPSSRLTPTVGALKYAPLTPTARSSRPSPVKSPATIAPRVPPTAYVIGGWKVPSPLPSNTDT